MVILLIFSFVTIDAHSPRKALCVQGWCMCFVFQEWKRGKLDSGPRAPLLSFLTRTECICYRSHEWRCFFFPHPHLLGRRNQPPCRAVEGLREQAGRNIWETQEKNSSSPPVFLPYQFVQDFCFSIMSSSTLNPNVFIAGEAQATLLQSHTIDPTAAVFCRWRAAARQRSYYS